MVTGRFEWQICDRSGTDGGGVGVGGCAKLMSGLDGGGKRDETLADGWWWVWAACWVRGSGWWWRWFKCAREIEAPRAWTSTRPSAKGGGLCGSASGRERVVLGAGPGYWTWKYNACVTAGITDVQCASINVIESRVAYSSYALCSMPVCTIFVQR